MSARFDDTAFPAASEADWRVLAEKALGDEPFASLVSHTEDGVAYGPIHRRQVPARPILRRDPAGAWHIVQRIDDLDPARANAQALVDLEGGADTLSFVFAGAPTAYGFGLPLEEAAIRTALAGVMLDIVRLRIEPHPEMERVAALVRQACGAPGGISFCDIALDHGLDPVGCFAVDGLLPGGDAASVKARLVALHTAARSDGCTGHIVEADGRVYHEAGASEAQELGAVLATALFYWKTLAGDEADLGAPLAAIGFTLAADQKQFQAMAKTRALRLLWSRVLAECGVSRNTAAIRIHVETSRRMMAARDAHTNILRGTVAAFAAATGGADSLSVLPFSIANGLAEEKARRLARNLQAILQDESGLARVCDPAAGSGGIEALTAGIAAAGWEEFRRIESEGGILASLGAGRLQARIAATRQARQMRIASGEDAMIGVSLYPLKEERAVAVLMPAVRSGMRGRPEQLAAYRLTEEMERSA